MEVFDAASKYEGDIGRRLGCLTFVGLCDERGDNNRVMGRFACDCGREVIYGASRMLRSAYRTHCGCQTDRGAHRTHGKRGSPEYRSWSAMKGRCRNPKHKDYPRWGGVGITVCDRWANSFADFLADVGPRPAGTSLDRINGRRGYEPGNVRWATPQQQAENRRDVWTVEIRGHQFSSVAAAARHFEVSETTIMRWCLGYRDARRAGQKSGGTIPPKPQCSIWRAA